MGNKTREAGFVQIEKTSSNILKVEKMLCTEVSRKVICRLKINTEDAEKIRSTIEAFSNACNYASEIAFRNRVFETRELHDRTYRKLRTIFKLPAALAAQVVHKVAASYVENSQRLHVFRERSLFLDGKLFSIKRLEKLAASITTLKGRLKAELDIGTYHRALLENPTRGARLILNRGEALIQIHVIYKVPLREMNDAVGVDLGTKNLLMASNGFQINGRPFNAKRQHFWALKSSLKEKGTSSARRRLKRLIKRENQWYKTTLHQYSRSLVKSLEEDDYLVMEKLQGTKVKSCHRKHRRNTRPSYQSLVISRLQQMISYKCADQGITVISVRPDFTSQRCPRCGTIDKSNRRSQALFRCVHCGYQHNADFIASINLRELALGGWAAISQPDAVPPNHRNCKLLQVS